MHVRRIAAPRPRRAARVVPALALVAGLALPGCSADDEFTRDDTVALFTEKGFSEEMAACMADGLIRVWGLDTFAEERQLTDEDEVQYTVVLDRCAKEVGIENVGTGDLFPAPGATPPTSGATTSAPATTEDAPTSSVSAATGP